MAYDTTFKKTSSKLRLLKNSELFFIYSFEPINFVKGTSPTPNEYFSVKIKLISNIRSEFIKNIKI